MRLDDVRRLSPLDQFLYFIRERHAIYLKRQAGLPPPWTDDAILQTQFFTNPYREHDKTTVWFREHVREPLRDDPRVILATVIFRWFNYLPTAEILLAGGNGRDLLLDWDEAEAFARLAAIREAGGQIFTGASMVNSPAGKPKLEEICRRISRVWRDRAYLMSRAPRLASGAPNPYRWRTMEFAHSELTKYEGLGGFGAYEIVCDLRYTAILDDATDRMMWCNPGPGAIRGLYRVLGREIPNKSNAAAPPVPKDWTEKTRWLLATMQAALPEMPPFEMREVEMSLCEVDKMIRLLRGEGKSKRRYNGTGFAPAMPSSRQARPDDRAA